MRRSLSSKASSSLSPDGRCADRAQRKLAGPNRTSPSWRNIDAAKLNSLTAQGTWRRSLLNAMPPRSDMMICAKSDWMSSWLGSLQSVSSSRRCTR